ncbi:hypothetical protein EDD21DRAFT_409144 [Dissophora ornata]|nr:hypothetical protein EDD21DRAFT_409144 [Dissophora ornata]
MDLSSSSSSSSLSTSFLTLASPFPTEDSGPRQVIGGVCEDPGAEAAYQPYPASASAAAAAEVCSLARCLSPVGGATFAVTTASNAHAPEASLGRSLCSRRRFSTHDRERDLDSESLHTDVSSGTEQLEQLDQNVFIDIVQAHIRSIRQSLFREQQHHHHHHHDRSLSLDRTHRHATTEPESPSDSLYHEQPQATSSLGPLIGPKGNLAQRHAEYESSSVPTWASLSSSSSSSLAPVWDPRTSNSSNSSSSGVGSGELLVGTQQRLGQQLQHQALREHAWPVSEAIGATWCSRHAQQTRFQTHRLRPCMRMYGLDSCACDACSLSITDPDLSEPGSALGPGTEAKPSIATDDSSTSTSTDNMPTTTADAVTTMNTAVMATRHALWNCQFADWYMRIVKEVCAKGFMTPEQQTVLLTRPLADSPLLPASVDTVGVGGAIESLAMMVDMQGMETGYQHHEHKPGYEYDPVDDERLEHQRRTPTPASITTSLGASDAIGSFSPCLHHSDIDVPLPSLQDFQNHAIPPSIFARSSTSMAPENGAVYHSEHDISLLEAMTLDDVSSLTLPWLDDTLSPESTLQADQLWSTDSLQQRARGMPQQHYQSNPLEECDHEGIGLESCPRPSIAILNVELAQILQENTDAVLHRTMQVCEYSQLCNRRMQEVIQLHQRQQQPG